MHSTSMPVEGIADAFLQGVPVSDADFDQLYAGTWRARSSAYWSPVATAMCAARWFRERGGRRVLDVGSGVGKFCLVGALTSGLEFVGVEHRPQLVAQAREAAAKLGVEGSVEFVEAPLSQFDATPFDCLYLYNPFGENLNIDEHRLDNTVELGMGRFIEDTRRVERIFDNAAIGTHVITYCGFGGRIPNSFAPDRWRPMGNDCLRLWVKRRDKSTGHYVDLAPETIRLETSWPDGSVSER